MSDVKKLKKQFFKRDGLFTLRKESESAYLYEVEIGGGISFEVFQKKTSRVCLDFENRIYSDTEVKERYPGDEDFGVWAWSYTSLASALLKFDYISESFFNNN